MPDPDPTPDPLPVAPRAVRKTVRVRSADLEPEPPDEPAGPPGVVFWFRLGCAVVAFAALVYAAVLTARLYGPGWDGKLRGVLVLAGVFAVYSLPLWWRRPRWWHWVYGLVVLLPGVVPFTNPLSILLLVFWCRKGTVRYFRHPPASYARPDPPADPAAPLDPPAALFALRWLCLLGCGACLVAVPVVAVAHAADPDAGWGVFGWLGGLAVAFGLFAVPLLARSRRPWVWWYGAALLAVCSLSGYLTLLAVPTLAVWLTRWPRAYFAARRPPDGGSPAPARV